MRFLICLATLCVAETAFSQPSSEQRTACVGASAFVDRGASVNHYLQQCTYLADQLTWQSGDGVVTAYPSWTYNQRDRLRYFFDLLVADQALPVQCPTPTENGYYGGRRYFTASEAFDVFAAHAAHALYIDLKHKVPWHLLDLPPVELERLLASSSYHSVIPSTTRSRLPTSILAGRDFQGHPDRANVPWELVCDPRDGYLFLSGRRSNDHKNLIGPTPAETLANISWWAGHNLFHAIGPPRPVEFMDHWRSAPYLKDRLTPWVYSALAGSSGPRIWVHGCHGSASLLIDLARSVNIPLQLARAMDYRPVASSPYTEVNGHGALEYGWGGFSPRVLVHVDDLYFTADSYAVSATGAALTEPQRIQTFFNQHWDSRTRLGLWGFSNQPPNYVGPGSPWVTPGPSTFADEPYFSPLSGWWQARPDSSGQWHYDSDVPYQDEKNYEACAWRVFLSGYCSTGHTGTRVSPVYSMPPVPFTRTQADKDLRASQCVAAYGGCATLQAIGRGIDYQSRSYWH